MTINTATVTMADIKEADTATLVETYNKATGKSIKKFADRAAAERLTWKAIQQVPPGEDVNAPSKEKKSAPKGGKRDGYENRTIELLVKENPKRAGSRAHKKFDILMKFDGKPLQEYKKQEGKFPSLDMEKGWPATEVRWAINLGLIKLVNGNSKKDAA